MRSIKNNLKKALKANGWQEVQEVNFNSKKCWYISKSPIGNILSIIYDFDLSFHFGYDKTTKTSAAICLNGEQTETAHYVLDYYNLCKDIITGVKTKEDIKI